MKKTAAIILILLALPMFYISIQAKILPPAITGIGFIVVAWVFFKEKA